VGGQRRYNANQQRREPERRGAQCNPDGSSPLIRWSAPRHFAADDPVFVGVTRHRPFRVCVERRLVAPFFDQNDMLIVVLRQHQVELQTAVVSPGALRVPAHKFEELSSMFGFDLEVDDNHDLAHRRSLSTAFRGIISHRLAPKQAPGFSMGENEMAYDALRTILPIAGWPEERLRQVEITGGADPVLPTPFRIGAAGTAALAATGLAAADLWELRGGRRQEVSVDLRQAVASLRSGHYMQINGAPISTERNPVVGVYPAKNGRWSYIHANFPNHRAAALSVLGVPDEREAVRQAVAKWDALELEEAILAAKGAGGMVRSMEEWAKHPQAAAIASLPLMEIVKIGDSAPEPLPEGERPLSGIRVLDLTRVLAGPTSARTLAEHGADVMKITAPHLPNIGYQEYDTGHGKLQAHLDLRQQRDVDTLLGLVREADIFTQGYRPGTLGNRGLSPEELSKLRPGLVYVSMCAFSHAGPWASRRGFDTVVQTISGITTRQGELFPGASPGPQFYPVSAIDYLTGYLMAFGGMVALARRAREGGSWLVRISLAQTGRWLVDRGEVPEAALKNVDKELYPAEIARWSIESDTPVGRLRHLGPTVRLSETAPYWARPSAPLGYHEPVWPARAA
jgi:crotonobetainyl-CoA:carnitine CoA-transferase CaiB-like acyl-CoA transferase